MKIIWKQDGSDTIAVHIYDTNNIHSFNGDWSSEVELFLNE